MYKPPQCQKSAFFFACLGVRTENLALLFALLANWTVPTRLWIFLSVFWYIYLTLPKLPSAISHEILRTKANQEYVINLLFCVESEYAIRFRKYETLYNIFFELLSTISEFFFIFSQKYTCNTSKCIYISWGI